MRHWKEDKLWAHEKAIVIFYLNVITHSYQTINMYMYLYVSVCFLNNWWKRRARSGQDGGVGKHTLPPRMTMAKITTRLQNKYHPELSENWAVRKSNNQGFKEATFIQMGRMGRDVQRGTETWRGVDRCKDTEWHGEVQRWGMGSPISMCGV